MTTWTVVPEDGRYEIRTFTDRQAAWRYVDEVHLASGSTVFCRVTES